MEQSQASNNSDEERKGEEQSPAESFVEYLPSQFLSQQEPQGL
jgi:hypothetical protein